MQTYYKDTKELRAFCHMTLHQIWPLTFPVLQVCLVPMWAEPVALFNMFLPPNPHLSHWLATFLLLNCWKAGGAHNGSEVVTSMQRANIPPIVVKEGSSMLITCNVTGTRDNISWYNSKGPLQGDDAGRTRKWSSEILISFEFFSSCMAFFIWKQSNELKNILSELVLLLIFQWHLILKVKKRFYVKEDT